MSVHSSAIAIVCLRYPCSRSASSFADTKFTEYDIVDHHAGFPEKLEGLVHRLSHLRVEGFAHLLARYERIATCAGDLPQNQRSHPSFHLRRGYKHPPRQARKNKAGQTWEQES